MNSEQQPADGTDSSAPAQPLRPQNSLLRRSDYSAAKRRPGEPEIYLSWEGEVYGPAAPDDVRAGIRVSYYEEGTAFWHEGMIEWRPLEEFPDAFATQTQARPAPRPGPSPTIETIDAHGKPRGRAKKTKPPKPRTGSRHGLWIVLLFCFLAVGLTVGVILLLMLI